MPGVAVVDAFGGGGRGWGIVVGVIPQAAVQDGVVSRQQALAAGLTPGRIRAELAAGRWQRVCPGVYATFTGPLPPRARLWAAVLRAGRGAVAGPATTAWLAGLFEELPHPLDVAVPEPRRARSTPWCTVTRRRDLADRRQPGSCPPRLRLEEALLDLCAASRRPEAVVDLVLRAVQRRLTTADRIAAALAARSAHRWRRLLHGLLADVRLGVRSALERRWLDDVHRPHRLPRVTLNRLDGSGSTRRYRDAEFDGWPLVVELDGREAHPQAEQFRDRVRDNRVTVSGRRTLRYGWREVVADPCGVAAELVAVLRALGWRGRPRTCGPGCALARSAEDRGRSGDTDHPHRPRPHRPAHPPVPDREEAVGGPT